MAVPSLVGMIRLATAYLASRYVNRPVGYQNCGFTAAAAVRAFMRRWARRYYQTPLRFDRGLACKPSPARLARRGFEFVVTCYTRASYFFLHGAGRSCSVRYGPPTGSRGRSWRCRERLFCQRTADLTPGWRRLGDFRNLKAAYRRGVMRIVAGLLPAVACALVCGAVDHAAARTAYGGAIWPSGSLA